MPKIIVNGVIREMTFEELVEMQDTQARHAAEEKHRPLSEAEVYGMIVRQQINNVDVDDQTALRMIGYYPAWEDLCSKAVTADKPGYKFVYGGTLYKTVQPGYTFVSHYPPGTGTESLFARIDEEHDGTKYDPIPYDGNMELTEGKYYSQDGEVYRCTRDTGNPVYHALADLVGLYVEVVNG